MYLASLVASICLTCIIQKQSTNQSKTYFYHLLKCFETPITLLLAFLFKFQHLLINKHNTMHNVTFIIVFQLACITANNH